MNCATDNDTKMTHTKTRKDQMSMKTRKCEFNKIRRKWGLYNLLKYWGHEYKTSDVFNGEKSDGVTLTMFM
jgi:hypothetical protein